MRKRKGSYPRPAVDVGGRGVARGRGAADRADRADPPGGSSVAGAGAVAQPHAVHDPAKVVVHLTVALALGGDCLAAVRPRPAHAPRPAHPPAPRGHRLDDVLDLLCLEFVSATW